MEKKNLTFILGFLSNHINSFKKKSIQGLLWRSQIKISAPHASCKQKKSILDYLTSSTVKNKKKCYNAVFFFNT